MARRNAVKVNLHQNMSSTPAVLGFYVLSNIAEELKARVEWMGVFAVGE